MNTWWKTLISVGVGFGSGFLGGIGSGTGKGVAAIIGAITAVNSLGNLTVTAPKDQALVKSVKGN